MITETNFAPLTLGQDLSSEQQPIPEAQAYSTIDPNLAFGAPLSQHTATPVQDFAVLLYIYSNIKSNLHISNKNIPILYINTIIVALF